MHTHKQIKISNQRNGKMVKHRSETYDIKWQRESAKSSLFVWVRAIAAYGIQTEQNGI